MRKATKLELSLVTVEMCLPISKECERFSQDVLVRAVA